VANHSSTSERPPGSRHQPGRTTKALNALFSFCAWLVVWAVLSHAEGWAFGVPLAAIATFAGYRLELRIGSLRWQAIPAFLGFFLRELFSGGWDVARRALHPRLPVSPAWKTFALTSRDPRVCLLLSAMVGLLPGTLASHHENQTLHVHALDQHQDWEKTVTELELRLSQLLGEKNV
jgi:multicomponent Na+:H+ antiporter subunit E